MTRHLTAVWVYPPQPGADPFWGHYFVICLCGWGATRMWLADYPGALGNARCSGEAEAASHVEEGSGE